MKGLTKLIVGIAAPLLVAGIVLSGVGWAMGADTSIQVPVGSEQIHVGWDGVGLTGWSSSYVTDTAVVEDMALSPFTRVDVELSNGAVTVSSGETYGIRLNSGSRKLQYSLENGTLKVWDEDLIGVQFSERGGSVEIFLPDGAALTDADITSALGGLELKNVQVETLNIQADLGDITAEGLQAGSAVLTAECGAVNLTDVEADELEAELSLGDMTATGLAVTDRLTVTSSLGSVSLEGELGESVSVTADMGDISAVSSRAEQWYGYELSTDLGEITVNGQNRGASASQKGEKGTMELHSDTGGITVRFS
ncbi:DUF4097 family beta strand repeat-containing protein [Pseudoflavonifractor capillosus]|uniref:DUF4097 domain-containing protein n=1 Tax=Pseudoflavonifractor capillosus TaxID=106588 RepID=A0A921MLE0_9FIRM|nr:DUF4097 family beta strand repeat-containing protein [Pseudoflavonifractor capillosus]HJG86141.1 DUF4097 domain-containing protein [Pseudoflavonifractor capillosus]